MAWTLIEHKVKKGENLTKIVKKYGHDGRDWKLIHGRPYNADFRKDHPDPNLIKPGAVFKLPDVSRKDLIGRIEFLWKLQDWVDHTISADAAVWAELKRLHKKRVYTRKEWRRVKAPLDRALSLNEDVASWRKECLDTAKAESGISPIVKCIEKTSKWLIPNKRVQELEKEFKAKTADHDKVEKQVKEITDYIGRLALLRKLLRAAVDGVLSIQNKKYRYLFG